MGMYDTIFCRYPLPGMEGDQSERDFQTKSLLCDLQRYMILADGSLMIEAYDIDKRLQDRVRIGARVNKRWEPCLHTGEVRFYDSDEEWLPNTRGKRWHEFSAYFVNGQLKELHRIS